MYLFLTSLVFVVLASCVPFTANDPRNYQGRSIIAVLHFLCLTVREEMAIVDICVVVFGSIALFHWMSVSRHSESTPDSRRVPLCVHVHRAFRTVQAALQTAAAVVSSHELVRGGNGGHICCS